MSTHQFITCDACDKEILEDDPPYYTRAQIAGDQIEQLPRGAAIIYHKMPRRDLCENCYRRIMQALVQAPESLWLLEGFEVQK